MSVLRRLLQWIGFTSQVTTTTAPLSRAPHQRWPEILHWQEGDIFELHGARCGQAFLVSVTEDGSAYVLEGIYKDTATPEKWSIRSLVGCNRSLRSREIRAEMKQSNDYMELIKQFNAAFEELQRRDKQNGIAA